ncbi:MAG: hypothetical protein ACP5I8_06085 [Phycisphaerae bacterium]
MNVWVPHTIANALLFSAAALFVLGLILWIEFIRMARPVLTVFMAMVGALFGYFSPLLWHTELADLTLVIIGAIVGIILGAVLFRLTQALFFAVLAALLCGGLLAQHYGAFIPQPKNHPPALRQPAQRSSAASSQPAIGKPMALRRRVLHTMDTQYQELSADQNRMNKLEKAQVMAAATVGMLVVILLGLLFPRAVSLIGGAWLGAAIIVWALAVFTRRYDPGLLKTILHNVRLWWIYTGLGLLGMAIQYRHIMRLRKKKKKDAQAAEGKKQKG